MVMRRTGAVVVIAALASGEALAQGAASFPSKPIKLVVPFAPAGPNDILARIVAQKLNEAWSQPVVVENRGGAGGTIGVEYGSKLPADGYTILVVSFPFSVMNALYPASKVDVVKDFAALNYIGYAPSLLVVNAATPYTSVAELIAAAKAQPNKLLYASTSNGSSAHLFMELFKSLTKASLTHVPYKGNGPAMVDLLGGQVPIMFANLPNGLPHVQSGRLRALGMASLKRIQAAPDIPTIAESGLPGYEVSLMFGLFAPAGTPREIVRTLHGEVVRVLATPDVRERLINDGAEVIGNSPEEFAAYMASETMKWAKVARDAGIKAE